MPNTLHNITLAMCGLFFVAAMVFGMRIVNYKLMYEHQVRETVYEILEEGR